MMPLMDALFIETNPVPVKSALSMMGRIEYELRLPLCNMSDTNFNKLKQALVAYGLIP
jgi:4-hydroxy-tetrahydrodipicolinate synthase